jgi:TetR/AcrR family transcriptional regulator, regulator of cefoperazone and chloramphenicol sensitivity
MDESRHASGPVTRDKLIEAAGEIFAEKGLHGALIRDITRRAGANIASVNYHFHDKFELYALVLRQAHQDIVAGMNQPLSADTPEGRVRQLLSAILARALDPARPRWHTLLLGRELLQPTPAMDLLHDMLRRPAQRLGEVVREIRPDLSEEQIMLAVCGIVAQCLFYVHHRHLAHRIFPTLPEFTTESLVDHVVEFSLSALRGLPADRARVRRDRQHGAPRAIPRRATVASKRKPT